jgi:cytochrome c biogenesis protein CcdA/thiol-disulfide isomerase/thioredoxin
MRAWLAIVVGAVLATAAIARAQMPPPPAELTPLVATDGVHAGEQAKLALQVTLAPGLHTNSNKLRDPNLIPITLTLEPTPGVTIDALVFPAPIDLNQAGSPQPLSVFTGEFALGVAAAIAPAVGPGDVVLKASLRYQACDERLCYAPKTLPVSWTLHVVPKGTPIKPQHADVFGKIDWSKGEKPAGAAIAPGTVGTPSTASTLSTLSTLNRATLDDFDVLGTANGYLGTADFLTFIHDAENGITEKGLFEGRGPLAILLIVFLGGLALNLTPCVLPMIPINLAIIGAGAKAGSRARGFLLGGAYGAAMAAVYGILGLIVILTAGTFGTINATWWFNAGIAILFIVLALAMFDVITIDFSGLSSNVTVGESSRGSFLVAFGMGAVAALLAGACVAPVVVQVVLFSSDLYAKGTAAALALPFVLGVGMAVPWPVAGAGIAAIPRPGAWMVRVKQVFGVIILATAAYYGYEAYSILSNRWVDADEVTASVQEMLKEGWHPVDEGLASAMRDGRPVLIDMWATWCKNCLTMDQTTLKDPEVNGALAGYVKIKFEAEDLDEPSAKAALQRFKSPGLPTYAILRPRPRQ